MNTLSYILLCMLVRKPCTGYELKQYLQIFWQAHHSQIYTLLAKLEREGYVSFYEEQTSTPKKIYSLTELGKNTVEKWIMEEAPDPINRDEFLGKIYVISMMQPETVSRLFNERKRQYTKKIELNQKKIIEIELLKNNPDKKDEWHNSLGRYLIIKRSYQLSLDEITWCDWAKEQYRDMFH